MIEQIIQTVNMMTPIQYRYIKYETATGPGLRGELAMMEVQMSEQSDVSETERVHSPCTSSRYAPAFAWQRYKWASV